jgi:phage terminase small subunit
MGKLTDKQERFCDEYLIDLNATRAAIRAGYSVKTATSIASENLSKPDIQKLIQEKREKIEEENSITRKMILEGYRKLAFYDSRKFYDENGNVKDVPDLDDDEAFALSAFEVMEEKGGDGEGHQVALGHTKKIKMSDRKGALDSLCKVLGYFAPDKVANTDKDGNDVSPLFKVEIVKPVE